MRQKQLEKKAVIDFIRSSDKPVGMAEIKNATDFQVDSRTVQRWLYAASQEGLIQIVGERKARKYHGISSQKYHQFSFLQEIPDTKRQQFITMLRSLWTHHSTALEGNTLTLGETEFILQEGLTVSGKPLKDHKEVLGHATAIDLLYDMATSKITHSKIKQLHKAVQTDIVFDIDKPYGDYKVVPNGTYLLLDNGKSVYHTYSQPSDAPALMERLIDFIEACKPQNIEEAIADYAIAHLVFGQVHPFWDGNGRIARLIANLVLLRAGYAPLVIPVDRRHEYITILSRYSFVNGAPKKGELLFHRGEEMDAFIDFCKSCYQGTIRLLSEIKNS